MVLIDVAFWTLSELGRKLHEEVALSPPAALDEVRPDCAV